jgi:hypothetical protein
MSRRLFEWRLIFVFIEMGMPGYICGEKCFDKKSWSELWGAFINRPLLSYVTSASVFGKTYCLLFTAARARNSFRRVR